MPKRHETTVKLDRDNVEWFKKTYPFGSLNGLLDALLGEFRKVHTVSPMDYATLGAQELKRALEEGK